MRKIIKNKTTKMQRRQYVTAYIFIAPVLLAFVIFIFIPLVMAVYLSFTKYNMAFVSGFVGFNNYKLAFTDTFFLKSLGNVLLFTLMYVPAILLCSLLVSVLLNRKLPGTVFFRTLFYLPAITSGVAASFVWMWLMNPHYGLFNQILERLGLPASLWLNGRFTALPSIALISVWSGIAGNMLIFLAALQGIPKELLEAADIDGCGGFRKFIFITVPILSPTFYFVGTMSIIGALQLFDLVFVTTQGGPEGVTMTPVMQIFKSAFLGSEKAGGLASAMSVILMLVIITVTFFTQNFTKLLRKRKKEAYIE